MVKLKRINQDRINRKGQSLVELSVFGSLLLLVLGVLLNYGLQYNYQQEVKMESFRRALKAAGESNLAKTQEVMLFKDLLIPDPSDRFALGQRDTFRGSGSVFWSNKTSISDMDFSTPERTPSVNYTFNPGNDFEYGFFPNSAWQTANINRTYTTANLVHANGAITTIGPLILKGFSDPYPGSQGKVYQAEEGWGPKEVMILMDHEAGGNCVAAYCPKTILDEATIINRGVSDYYPVYNVTGNVGQVPSIIKFLDGEGGQINSTLGYMQVDNKVIDKHRSLTLTENPTQYQSSETLGDTEAITHVVITSSGDDSPTIVFSNKPVATWTTSK